jgi:hypothetical protein
VEPPTIRAWVAGRGPSKHPFLRPGVKLPGRNLWRRSAVERWKAEQDLLDPKGPRADLARMWIPLAHGRGHRLAGSQLLARRTFLPRERARGKSADDHYRTASQAATGGHVPPADRVGSSGHLQAAATATTRHAGNEPAAAMTPHSSWTPRECGLGSVGSGIQITRFGTAPDGDRRGRQPRLRAGLRSRL